MCDQQQAMTLLKSYPLDATIAEFYDDEDFSNACILLIPCFEYPEWSYKTVSQVLKYVKN